LRGRRFNRTKQQHENIKDSSIQGTNNHFIFDTTLLIGIITAIGYYMAFSYEKGYKSYYHINEVFLGDITILNILISIAALVSVWTILYPLVDSFGDMFLSSPVKFGVRRKLLIPCFLILICLYISPKDNVYLWLWGVFLFIALFYNFIFSPLLSEGKGYKRKLISHFKIDNYKDFPTFSEKIHYFISHNKKAGFVFFISIFILSSLFSRLLGEGNAYREKDYLILENTSTYVVIDQFKENFIIAPVDLKTKTITPKFEIVDLKSDKVKLSIEAMFISDGLKVKKRESIK
jgi:hypothetical protein